MNRLFINRIDKEIQTAYVENGELIEYFVEKQDEPSIAGNIYAGIIKNINNQFAFIDIGLSRNAFLCLNDNKEKGLFDNGALKIKSSQTIVVQVMKDSTDIKGAAVTTELSFPSESMVVYLTKTPEIGISKKIEEKEERVRLKKIAYSFMETLEAESLGLIMRTNCKNKEANELKEEFSKLVQNAKKILATKDYIKAPGVLYKNIGLNIELIKSSDEVITNCSLLLDEAKKFNNNCILYEENMPMFSNYSLHGQIDKAFSKKAWLKSGAYIVIEHTEACVVIDVNSGKNVSKKKDDELAYKINCEAAKEIAKQARLRNLSGMIVIDFIGMKDEALKKTVVKNLEEYVKKDRLSTQVLGMTFLDVVMLTRKRERASLK